MARCHRLHQNLSHIHYFSVNISMRINAKKYIELECENCKIKFNRELKEYTRCKNKGFSISCSRSCGATLSNLKNPRDGNINNLIVKENDKFSSFRYYLNKARNKKKYGDTNLTLEYLKNLWEKQNGICPYSEIKMELPYNTQGINIKANLFKASLDRIDSSKGYIQGNVEFVCLGINYAKNGFSKNEVLEFINKIKNSN